MIFSDHANSDQAYGCDEQVRLLAEIQGVCLTDAIAHAVSCQLENSAFGRMRGFPSAWVKGAPLLYKGNEFGKTDLRSSQVSGG